MSDTFKDRLRTFFSAVSFIWKISTLFSKKFCPIFILCVQEVVTHFICKLLFKMGQYLDRQTIFSVGP